MNFVRCRQLREQRQPRRHHLLAAAGMESAGDDQRDLHAPREGVGTRPLTATTSAWYSSTVCRAMASQRNARSYCAVTRALSWARLPAQTSRSAVLNARASPGGHRAPLSPAITRNEGMSVTTGITPADIASIKA